MADDPAPTPAPNADPASSPSPAPDPAPSPAPAPAPTAADWRDSITDKDLKEHASRFASPTDLVKANVEFRKKISAAVIAPGKDAKPEEVAEYRKKLGVPETADGYKFVTADGSDPSDADKAFQAKMAKAFHDNNVPASVAEGLNKAWNEHVTGLKAAMVEADKTYAKQSEDALRKEWGGDYDANRALAKRGAAAVFADGLQAALQLEGKDGRYLMDHPVMVKAMAKLGREMGEDGLRGNLSEADRSGLDTEIRDLDKQYYDAYHKGDRQEAQRLDKKRQELYARRHGNAPIVGSHGRAA